MNAKTSFVPAVGNQPIVPITQLKRLPYPITQTNYLSIGGGIGSFCWVDYLRVCGVAPTQIKVIGLDSRPYGRFAQLCQNSQIAEKDRLRSNSDARPDNLWGFPSYAVGEIAEAIGQGAWRTVGKLAWQIFAEPTFAETYTPRLGDVSQAMEQEAKRIAWQKMWHYGRAFAIRKTDDERYLVGYQAGERIGLVVTNYLHLAVGYAMLRMLPALQSYRQWTGDSYRVVNAYEKHDHVYNHLAQKGGTVLIRGRGIAASHIIEQLVALRQEGANISILHLMRSPLPRGSQFGYARRLNEHHWEYQPFNWPKSAFGGELRQQLADLPAEQRELLFDLLGGTTSSPRSVWRKMITAGLAEGWYQIRFGELQKIHLQPPQGLCLSLHSQQFIQEESQLWADFVIDCTGLEAELTTNPLLDDLIRTHKITLNRRQRLPVNEQFELLGMENGRGRLFAAGAISFGNAFAPVDSFLGMQLAAQESVKRLIMLGAPNVQPLTVARSITQWIHWVRGVAP